jgi:hypothetical protein
MVMQTAGSDVLQALLKHRQRLRIGEDFDRFQDRLKQFRIHNRKRLLVVPRDPNHSILTQPLVQLRELSASFRDVESGCSHNASLPVRRVLFRRHRVVSWSAFTPLPR